jgi:hypothetical protein
MIKLRETIQAFEGTMSNNHILITPKDEDTWLTWKQVHDLTDMERTAFYYYVDKQNGVRSRKGKNKRDREYNSADTKRLEARRKNLTIVYSNEDSDADLKWLIPNDLPAILDLDKKVYDEYLVGNLNLYASWITKNPRIALCAFDKLDAKNCLAYISAIPLPEKLILRIMSGEMNELDIRDDQILTYDDPGEYTLLVNSVVSSEPKYLKRVLDGVFDFWSENAPERKIKRMYAQAATPGGRMLIQKFYFSALVTISDDTLMPLDGAYFLDMDQPSASREIRRFQEKVASKN